MNGASRLRQTLTLRQAVTISLLTPLTIGVVVASLTDRERVADALLGILVALGIVGVLQVRRRVAAAHQSNRALLKEVRTVVEQTQRRLVKAVEQERLAGVDRQQALLTELARAHRRTERATARQRDAQTGEFEAMLQLFAGEPLRAPMPASTRTPLRAADLLAVRHLVDTERPALVLELGGGTSTVWLGYALERFGGRLVCVDDDAASAARTRAMVAEHGLDRVAEVREAPLRPLVIDGAEHAWYDLGALDDLTDIDLVVLGGPRPGGYDDPAVAVLQPRLAPTATVFRPAADPLATDADSLAADSLAAAEPDAVRPAKLPAARARSTLTSA